MVDYHIHSIFSDGKNTYNEIITKAVTKGIKELGFSDHFCLHYPNWVIKKENFDKMGKDILSIKEKNTLPVNIKFGLEVDYIEGMEQEIEDHINQFPLDYVIGSVHYIRDWNFDINKGDYTGIDIDQFYADYFELLLKAAKSGLFDIIGHADIVKKFDYYPSYDLSEKFEMISKEFCSANVTVELNTSGRDKPCKDFYPSDKFLNYCFKNNVPVTLGSDTHKVTDIGRYFTDAIQKLKNIGYRKIAIFEKRKRNFIPL